MAQDGDLDVEFVKDRHVGTFTTIINSPSAKKQELLKSPKSTKRSVHNYIFQDYDILSLDYPK